MIKKTVISVILFLLMSIVISRCTKFNLNEFTLRTLNGIKKISNNNVNFEEFENKSTMPISHEIWDGLLQKYVKTNGLVDYKNFKKDSTELKTYLDLISANPPNSKNWNQQNRLAYWINAYNAFTVKLILDHYPIKSIQDIAGGIPMVNSPWDLKFFNIGGLDFDLNTIEHDILRNMEEPRIHFAINCASASCPVLRAQAYTTELLEEQLSGQTMDFLNDPSKNKISKDGLQLSKIFSWFKVDFEKEGTLLEFIEKQSSTNFSDDISIDFLDYDWSLNE